MNRNITNVIRYVMDECIPPVIRDSRWFMYPFYLYAYRGKNISNAMNFKKLVYKWTNQQYADFYKNIDTISRNRVTDLNEPCLSQILASLEGVSSAIDVGSGSGYLLECIHHKYPNSQLHGIDLKSPSRFKEFRFTEGNIENLPFPDNAFEAVICTHTLEHCLQEQRVAQELVRICSKKLIVVVPKQRFYFYTLDEHVNFYTFAEQLTGLFQLSYFEIKNLGGDWFYQADLNN